jgi:hypothetical protein
VITITLDRPRAFRYTTRALRLVEERSKRHLGELLITNASLSSAAWLIWGGLLHVDEGFLRRDEPTLTIDDVCDLLDEHWFKKDKHLTELAPIYAEAVVEAGIFRRDPVGKADPDVSSGFEASGSLTGFVQ